MYSPGSAEKTAELNVAIDLAVPFAGESDKGADIPKTTPKQGAAACSDQHQLFLHPYQCKVSTIRLEIFQEYLQQSFFWAKAEWENGNVDGPCPHYYLPDRVIV